MLNSNNSEPINSTNQSLDSQLSIPNGFKPYVPSEHRAKDRLLLNESIYHSSVDSGITHVSSKHSRMLSTTEQPYLRRIVVGESSNDWIEAPLGWLPIELIDTVVVQNNSTDKSAILEVGLGRSSSSGSSSIGIILLVHYNSYLRIVPKDVVATVPILLRSNTRTKCTIMVIPK